MRSVLKMFGLALSPFLFWLAICSTATAQEPTAGEAASYANNAWVLTSSALVLFMTAPGLAMFYSGLVRKKNVLSVMMQCLFLMGLLTVVWGLWGYSLSFGGDPTDLSTNHNPYI